MLHLVDLLRAYLGLETWTLAHLAGISMKELAEVLYDGVVGKITKYQKLAKFFDLPVDLLIRNDYAAMPVSFFKAHTPLMETIHSDLEQVQIGNQGEQLVLELERKRVAKKHPGLSHLIMKIDSRPLDILGFDLVSFDDIGQPVAVEVKTSADYSHQVIFTSAELECAHRMMRAGYRYQVVLVRNVHTGSPEITRYDFKDYIRQYSFSPLTYTFQAIETQPVSGLKYFRMKAHLSQRQFAQRIGKCHDQIIHYETGRRVPLAEFYLRCSKFFGVSVMDLLQWYDPQTGEVVPPPKMEEISDAFENLECRRDLSSTAGSGGSAAQPAGVCSSAL